MKTCSKICNECPFRKDSLKGWLGNVHTVEQIMNTLQFEGLFSCHLHRNSESTNERIVSGEIPICRGFLATASASCKLFGQHPLYGKDLRRLQDEITDKDKELVLDKWSFKKHHENGIKVIDPFEDRLTNKVSKSL